jgi:hypothetical protein
MHQCQAHLNIEAIYCTMFEYLSLQTHFIGFLFKDLLLPILAWLVLFVNFKINFLVLTLKQTTKIGYHHCKNTNDKNLLVIF